MTHSTRTVTLSVTVRADIAEAVEELHRAAPDVIAKALVYGVTRNAVYRQLQDAEVGCG